MQLEHAPEGVRETGAALSATARPRRSSFRPDVEGLRGVAVLAVILYHANIPGITGGYVGVDVFFVISGFLITGILISEQERTNRISILGFYARRVRRILPAATLVLCVTVVASYAVVGVTRAQGVAHDAYWVALFLGNYHFATTGVDYFNRGAPPSPLLHYWSLGVEEQFYVLWPLLLLVSGLVLRQFTYRVKVAVILSIGLVASMVWSLQQTSTAPIWAYFSPFTRAWELGIGGMIAVVMPQLSRVPAGLLVVLSWTGLGAIVTSAFVYSAGTPFPGTAALLPVLGAAAVIVGGSEADRRGAVAVLGVAPVRFVGRISYSLYLWHWPVLVLAAGYLGYTPGVGPSLLLLGGAGILATASYLLVESPIRSSRFLKARTDLVGVLLGALLVGSVLLVATVEIHVHQVSYHRPAQLQHPTFP